MKFAIATIVILVAIAVVFAPKEMNETQFVIVCGFETYYAVSEVKLEGGYYLFTNQFGNKKAVLSKECALKKMGKR